MAGYVPRDRERYKKRELLQKRIVGLMSTLASGASAPRLAKAVERVRSAAVAYVRAKRLLLTEPQRNRAAYQRQLENLDVEEKHWLSVSAEQIVKQFAEQRPKSFDAQLAKRVKRG